MSETEQPAGATGTGPAADPEPTPDAGPTYQVVVNHEEQFSIWPAERELPAGWRADGTVGTESECLAYIERVWTDMRPLSAR